MERGKEGDDVWFADRELPDAVRAHIADHRTGLDKTNKTRQRGEKEKNVEEIW